MTMQIAKVIFRASETEPSIPTTHYFASDTGEDFWEFVYVSEMPDKEAIKEFCDQRRASHVIGFTSRYLKARNAVFTPVEK